MSGRSQCLELPGRRDGGAYSSHRLPIRSHFSTEISPNPIQKSVRGTQRGQSYEAGGCGTHCPLSKHKDPLSVMDYLIAYKLKVQASGYMSCIQVLLLFCVACVFKLTTLTAPWKVLRGILHSLSPTTVCLPHVCHRYKQNNRYKMVQKHTSSP